MTMPQNYDVFVDLRKLIPTDGRTTDEEFEWWCEQGDEYFREQNIRTRRQFIVHPESEAVVVRWILGGPINQSRNGGPA